MSIPEKIEHFIASHLAGALYTSADPDQRRAALTMAEHDVLCHTGKAVDKESDLFAAAVGEQAIYLLLNCSRLMTPAREIVSETVEGAGSVTYASGEFHGFFSPRALELCNALKSGKVTLQRG